MEHLFLHTVYRIQGVHAIGSIPDCLPPELYHGQTGSHPWGERPGHIPGAVNVPYLANLDPALATAAATERDQRLAQTQRFTFPAMDALAEGYRAAGVTPDQQIITYCGRGYAGSAGLLALKVLGYQHVQLYDGSWAEWSADPDLPTETS